jgi:hypothetical protein
MAEIISYLFGKAFFRIAIKILVFGLLATLFIVATQLFLSTLLTQAENLIPSMGLTNFGYILSAMLPSNTAIYINVIFSAQMTAITYTKTMWFINNKVRVFGQGV